jgi:hypothetical protein
MPAGFARVYRSFAEFEREELRKLDTLSTSIDDMLGEMHFDELDFGEGDVKKSKRRDENDD